MILNNESGKPACDDECGELVRRRLSAMGMDMHVTHIPPIVKSDYESLDMRCPHGVLWFTEPTGEQIAKWIAEGVA